MGRTKTAVKIKWIQILVEKAVKDENGFVLIEDGANAYGTVTKSDSAGMMGTSGTLEITVDKVEAFNGKDIPLRGSKDDKGASSTGAVVAGALLISWVSIFFRGTNAVIPPGTILRAYVAETTVLSADVIPAPTENNSDFDFQNYLGIVTSTEKTKEGGFTILKVASGGLSEFAGIRKGDVLTKIDTYNLKEHDIDRVASYIALRYQQKAVITTTLLRDGKPNIVKMQL